jgi:hypothetical protein
MTFQKQLQDMIRITDEEDEHVSEQQSIKTIILRQINKIGDICSKEMIEGYWQIKPVSVGGNVSYTRTYNDDSRKAYCNSVDFIIDLTYPLGDTPYKKVIDDNESMTELKDVEEKLKRYKKIFREINKMFERMNFFNTDLGITEGVS